MPSQESRDVADIHQRLDSITRQIEQISRPAPRGDDAARRSRPRRADAWPASSTTPFRASTRGCRRFPTPRRPGRPRCRKSSARPRWSSAPQPRSIAPRRRSARPRWILRSPKSPRARTNSTVRRRGRCRRAAPRTPRRCASAQPNSAQPMMQAAPAGPDFSSLERHLLKITSQIEALQRPDHVEQSIAAFRSELAEIRQRHHRGDAAPGDRIDRERNPLAVPPHRRQPARTAATARRWPASSARSAKSAKCCAR